MNVISLYLPLWVASTFSRGEVWYGFGYSASMLAVAVASPFVGKRGETSGHKLPLLFFSLAAVLMTAFIGTASRLGTVLVLFATANFAYQLALVSYNALLPSVAGPAERGRVSGLGVALGYVGSFLGMYLVYPFVDRSQFAALPDALQRLVNTLTVQAMTAGNGVLRENAFIPTAVLFGLFSIPLFLFVRERRVPPEEDAGGAVWDTLREILRTPDLRWFYLGTFLYMDAVHTVYIVMATYGKLAVGLGDGQIIVVMSIAIGTAIAGSFVYGALTDRAGSRIAILTVIANWIIALAVAIGAVGFRSFLVVAILAGIGMGGVEVVTRVALLRLVGEERSGRFFGFFNFTGKASSIVGPQIWGATLLALESAGAPRYRVAVGALLLLTVAGLFVMRLVRFDEPRAAVVA